jgi:hypothetical protein
MANRGSAWLVDVTFGSEEQAVFDLMYESHNETNVSI